MCCETSHVIEIVINVYSYVHHIHDSCIQSIVGVHS